MLVHINLLIYDFTIIFHLFVKTLFIFCLHISFSIILYQFDAFMTFLTLITNFIVKMNL